MNAPALDDNSTLPDVLLARVRESGDDVAYRQYRDGAWYDMTWNEFAQGVARWQAALRAEGYAPGDRVALCLQNRVEWALFDQAALGLGLVVVPLYFSDRPDNMAFCLNDAGARFLLVAEPALWQQLRPQVTTIERVVCLTGALAGDAKIKSLSEWLPAAAPMVLERGPAKASDLATLVYTSGTTGRPKGVMLTHRNIVSNLIALMDAVPQMLGRRHVFLSFLPLSHMFERTVGYYIPIAINAQVTYARSVRELSEDLQSQRPTVIVTVPLIFERIYAKIDAEIPAASPKRRLFDLAASVGWRRFKREATASDRLLWPLLNALVARKLRGRLGGNLAFIMLGGAALPEHLLKIFTGMGLTFIHGYGLTETSPVASANRLTNNDPLSVGAPLKGVETRVAANGELCIRGPLIMRGYWNQPEATRAVLDADGWFHTGDKVEVREGRIYIRGRIKDVIVLSNGEKVPPGDAEQAILRDSAFEQVMIVGEGRPALGLLAVTKIDDVAELCRRANAQLRDFPGYAKIRHIARIGEAWTIDNGLLTPTMKPKRVKIAERYADEIERMFRERTCSDKAATSVETPEPLNARA